VEEDNLKEEHMERKTVVAALVVASASLAAASASATDGYFSHGYGLIAKGMGGASTATASDTFGGASNPAKMVFVGDRIDLGIDLFSPQRSASRSGSDPALNIDGSSESDSTLFYIPEFGYNKLINPRLALGVSVYGNGGMNTDYPGGQIPGGTACGPATGPGTGFNPAPGPYNLLCGNGRLGVDLSQLVIAPTVSYKLSEGQAIGIAPLFGYQRFKAEGLQAFDNAPGFPPFTSSPGNVTNRGYDSSTGFGVRFGYQGRAGSVSFGAAYATRMHMSEFKKYQGLFAENGDFAEACERSGLAFIGPRVRHLRLMADKPRARRIVEKAGVRVLPGSPEPLADLADARTVADTIGYPWLFALASALGTGGAVTAYVVMRRAEESAEPARVGRPAATIVSPP